MLVSCRWQLGCGLGAIGLAAASSGASEVLLTDAESANLDNVHEAATATGLEAAVSTEVFDWSVTDQVEALCARDEPFDVVMAADVLYDEAAPRLVCRVLDALLQKEGALALIADPEKRAFRTAFDIACTELGLKVREGPMPGPPEADAMRLLSVSRINAMA